MAKIKNWRLALAAVCMAVVLCVLTFACVSAPIGGADSAEPQIAHAEETNVASVGGTPYTDVKSAIEAAHSGSTKTVLLTADATISTDLEIYSDVTFIVPYDKSNPEKYKLGENDSASESSSENKLSWHSSKNATPIYTLTIADTATVRVKGTFAIGGMTHNTGGQYSGATRGEYSKCINNGNVVVEAGGNFEIYGLVTGTGGIQVEADGKLLQPFVVLDYKGGNATKSYYEANVPQSPFSEYSMVNVQCDKGIIVKYKGVINADCELYTGDVGLGSWTVIKAKYNHTTVALISYPGYNGSTSLIELNTEQSQAEIIYKEPTESGTEPGDKSIAGSWTQYIGRTKIVLTGGAIANAMQMSIHLSGATFKVDTTTVFAFPVPYNWDIEIKDGSYSLQCNFAIMPGARLTVGNGATLNTESNLYIYDGLTEEPSTASTQYPTAAQLKAANYPTNGELIIDGGTLNIKQGKTFLGAVQTTGNASSKIIVEAGAVLSGTIKDGARTEKLSTSSLFSGGTFTGCNYVQMDSTARVCGFVRGVPTEADISAGKTYVAVNGNTWTLNPRKGKKCDGQSHDKNTHNLVDIDINPDIEAPTMIGFWKEQHSECVFDWNNADSRDKAPSESERIVEVSHYCDVFGCEAQDKKSALYATDILDDVIYKGSKFEPQTLFDSYYGHIEGVAFGGNLDTMTEANTYSGEVTLPADGQYLFRTGSSYAQSHTMSVTVAPYTLTKANVTGLEGDKLPSMEYTGKQLQPAVALNANGGALKSGEHYTLAYGANKDVKTGGSVTIKGTRNYAGEVVINFDITPTSIAGGSISGLNNNGEYVYTGSEVKPSNFEVKKDAFALTADDYTVACSGDDLVNVTGKELTLTVTGTGNFKDSISATYKIIPADLSSAQGNITVVYDEGKDGYVYTGKAITPTLKIMFGGAQIDDRYYSVEASNNVDASRNNPAFTVTYSGNFEGSQTGKFVILQKDIADAVVTVSGKYTYNGNEQTVTNENVSVALDGYDAVTISNTFEYQANKGAGKATLTVTGNGNFTGKASGQFEIGKADATVTVTPATGIYGDKPQDMTFSVEGFKIAADEAVIRAAVSIAHTASEKSGKGSYDVDVTVAPLDNYNVAVNGEEAAYTVKERNVTVTVKPQTWAVYNGKEQNAKSDAEQWEFKQGSAMVNGDDVAVLGITLEGKGTGAGSYDITANFESENYKVEFEGTTGAFKIAKAAATVTVTPAEGIYGVAPAEMSFEVAGEQTTEDKTTIQNAVTISHKAEQWSDVGKYDVTVDVAELDNYTVEVKGDKQAYTVNAKDIKDATVTVSESKTYTYNGSPILPDKQDITLTLAGYEGKNITYTLSADDNTDKGVKTLKVTGTNNYAGTATGTFEIKAADITITVDDLHSAKDDDLLETYGYSVQGQFFGEDAQIFEDNIAGYDCNADKTTVGNEYTIKMQFTVPLETLLPNYNFKINDGHYSVTDSIFKNVTFTGGRLTYDGQLHKLEVKGTEGLADPTIKYDYHMGDGVWKEFPQDGVKDAGIYNIRATVTVEGHESKYEQTRVLTIDKKNIGEAEVSVGGEYIYTGAPILPAEDKVNVTLADWEEKITFSYRASENTNAGTANITVTGTGNYTGTANGTFRIDAKDIAGAIVTVKGTYTYDGNAQSVTKENVTATLDGFGALTISDEFAYANNTDAGTATVTVTGIGNFKGEASGQFEIEKATATVTVTPAEGVYGTQPAEMAFEVTGYKTEADKAIIQEAVSIAHTADKNSGVGSYDVTVNVGELKNYNVTVNGKENAYTVKEKSIAGATQAKVGGEYVYTGEAVIPAKESVTFALEGYAFEDITFEIEAVGDTVNKGEKQLKVKGVGNYNGEFTVSYNVAPASIDSLTVGGATYNGERQNIAGTIVVKAGEKLTLKNTDYSVTYSRGEGQTDDLTNAGDIKVTVTANEESNFAGSLTETFTIAKKGVNITLEGQRAEYSKQQPAVEQNKYSVQGLVQGDDDKLGLVISVVANEDGTWNVGKYDLSATVNGANYFLESLSGDKEALQIYARVVYITLKEQTWAVYNGGEQKAKSDAEYWEAPGVVEDDSLNIVITGGGTNANSYDMSFEYSNDNYDVRRAENNNVKFKIAKKEITVKVLDQAWATYDGQVPEIKQGKDVAWTVEDGAICNEDDLGITLSAVKLTFEAGTYNIDANFNNGNYTVRFEAESGEENATFTIAKAVITVTVIAKTSVYGNKPEALEVSIDGLIDKDKGIDVRGNYLEISCEVTAQTPVGKYDINCRQKADIDNYTVDIVNEVKYDVTKRPIGVQILDQETEFEFGKTYAPDNSKWELIPGSGELVNGDSLDITLSAGTVAHGGTYTITGENANPNYDVSFENGTFTVTKLDISGLNTISLMVGGEPISSDAGSVKYFGVPLVLLGVATANEGSQVRTLSAECYIDGEKADSINSIGEVTITVSIVDVDYSGSRVFTVTVTDEQGYDSKIKDVLAALAELVGDKQSVEVTLADFDLVKDIAEEIAKLDSEERELAADDLEEYLEFIDAYNSLTEVDDAVIETAKRIADAPIRWLYEAMAAASAIAALAYVALKGGRIL